MKYFIIIFSSLLLFACGTVKDSDKDNHNPEQTTEETVDSSQNYRVVGIVRENSKGCGFCIETEIEPNKIKFLLPLNLDNAYLSEGTKIKFEYAINRKTMPENCKADFVVKVYDVTRIR